MLDLNVGVENLLRFGLLFFAFHSMGKFRALVFVFWLICGDFMLFAATTLSCTNSRSIKLKDWSAVEPPPPLPPPYF